MLEQLLDLQVAYERSAPNSGAADPAAFDQLMRAAFPGLVRAIAETIEENRRLRGLSASSLAPAEPSAAPLEFEGYSDPVSGDVTDSLNELATARGIVAGEEVTVEEHFARFVRYKVSGGPTADAPLQRFEFTPLQDRMSAQQAGGGAPLVGG